MKIGLAERASDENREEEKEEERAHGLYTPVHRPMISSSGNSPTAVASRASL